MASLPLLLLPGLLCDERLWRDPAAALADVATVHQADLTHDDSVAGMAARVLASGPPVFALAALSMGGYVAFEILRQAPQRVARLALLDTTARLDPPKRRAVRRAGLAMAETGRFAGVTRKLLPQLVHESRVDSAVGEEVMAMAQRVGRDAFLRQQRAIIDRPDSEPLLPAIAVPTLLGVGEDDRMTLPEETRLMHDRIPGARLHVFARCGHLPPMEVPEETTAVLRDWLTAA
ncbi:pimeloyl-ACP methyl ester carboxylesterase [Pseudoxanthomonas japonensis]|uniref:alpha/beta fold hydrolase n=1 Tax=Pseudoxanthomonas japonensis TaxID=69284 RepID=UPI00285C9E2A|nr:alpha/beta fold hydrolase [Pseudoxanthomonas japonensis]MDR7069751.1 pimeloyl-ACP methyl ester carboxylesterase [Pseudoxanthomonas japonensis]